MRRCPREQELLVEYKPFEPAFYATDIPDWGSALLICQELGERARVLVDLGHHLPGVNVEQIVALLARSDRLGGFHFNNRKYADDDLIVGSTNPFELFLIFCELMAGGSAAAAPDDRPVPQRRGEGRGDGAQRREPPGGLRQGAARRPRALRSRQLAGDVLGGHEVLLDAYNTDVRPLCARCASRSAPRRPSRRAARLRLRRGASERRRAVPNAAAERTSDERRTQSIDAVPDPGIES
jgi:L-rhamnose isomerase/sugar isomerase